MSTSKRKTIAALNQLIEICKDGENGYCAAGEDVQTAGLKNLFHSYGEERAQFAAELLAAVHQLDDASQRAGTVAAAAHRGWMSVKAQFTGHRPYMLVAECERGEQSALKAYKQALKEPLPEDVRALVEKQYGKIQEAHDRMHGLRVISTLHQLVATCQDAERGYRAAEEEVTSGELKELFDAIAQQRAQAATELRAELSKLGDDSKTAGTAAAAAHRAWMFLRTVVTRKDAGAILHECERGEQRSVEGYEQALKQPLPPELHALIEKQASEVREAYQRIRGLGVISVLPSRMATCQDGEQGFRRAAAEVDRADLKELFRSWMMQRTQFANELRGELRRLGDVSEQHGTCAGFLHRGWMGSKAVFRGGEAASVLAECERGEHAAWQHYEAALKQALPAPAHALVEKQSTMIQDVYNRIRQMQREPVNF